MGVADRPAVGQAPVEAPPVLVTEWAGHRPGWVAAERWVKGPRAAWAAAAWAAAAWAAAAWAAAPALAAAPCKAQGAEERARSRTEPSASLTAVLRGTTFSASPTATT